MAVGRLASISLDCADPQRVAAFWAELVGGETAFTSPDFVAVRTDLGWLTAVRVADHRPPTWPDGPVPKQMHLDVSVDDLERAETEAIRLGARRAAEQPAPERYRVLLDPGGHPFCLSTGIPD
jgi:glyoxalase superfamily protein